VKLFPARRYRGCLSSLRLRANGRNIVDHWTPNIVGCYMLRPFAHPVACCWMLLRVVAQSLKPVKLFAPCKRTQRCWLTTPNIVGSCCARLQVALGYCSFQSTWQPDLHALTKLYLPTLLVLSTQQGIHPVGEFFRWIFMKKKIPLLFQDSNSQLQHWINTRKNNETEMESY